MLLPQNVQMTTRVLHSHSTVSALIKEADTYGTIFNAMPVWFVNIRAHCDLVKMYHVSLNCIYTSDIRYVLRTGSFPTFNKAASDEFGKLSANKHIEITISKDTVL